MPNRSLKLPDEVAEMSATNQAIFSALLTHEYMSLESLADKAGGLKVRSVGAAMTHLRRTGWVESKGPKGHRLWRRREQWAEPQPDFHHRKPGGSRKKDTLEHHMLMVGEQVAEAQKALNGAINSLNEVYRRADTLVRIAKLARELPSIDLDGVVDRGDADEDKGSYKGGDSRDR